jgi:molybdenum cofactor cytidylyltransferase
VRTAAVVLCAGGGSRFMAASGEHKLLAPYRGRPVVAWALEHALEAALDVTMAVTGAADIAAAVPPGVTVIENPQWADGIATSLQVAVATARQSDLDAIVVGLGDQPLVLASAWRAVAASRSPLAVATYAGARRNPVRLGRSVWNDLPRSGDEGARVLMRRRPEMVEEVPCEGDPVDIDTVEDLDR